MTIGEGPVEVAGFGGVQNLAAFAVDSANLREGTEMILGRYMAYTGVSTPDSIPRARRVRIQVPVARREWYWERLPVQLRSDWEGYGLLGLVPGFQISSCVFPRAEQLI